ncbi:multidrug effflux MFS transporter [Propionibacterium australiense]|uniref:Bcr/CflA family efflux MFS transporter n=1 Tax=Propionibacterium australiense TaxID=119981 RepID=A0A8B3FKR9_9ACTN|nr:multidrug effflux MFS transporter [Propionibacterium australiense]RLP11909.1 Bcr/CflA family efflux MFS transporter [Propionibacterium australiense]
MSNTEQGPSTAPASLGAGLLCVLALLSAAPPLGTDMYLSTFVQMAADLNTSASAVQLTLTSFMVGMGAGQLIAGPVSDATGRRPVLLIGTGLMLLASALTIVAPSIGLLIALRLLTGLGGGAAVALARAVVADRTHGIAAAKAFSMLMMIQGVAPVAAPVIGGLLATHGGWRGIFAVITACNLAAFVLTITSIEETLPSARRNHDGPRAFFAVAGRVVSNRRFMGFTLVTAFGFGVMFAYISGSPFVLQETYGLSQLSYALLFGSGALWMTIASGCNTRLVDRFPVRSVLHVGLGVMTCGALAFLVAGLVHAPLWYIVVCMLTTVTGVALALGNATALATDALGGHATGTGSGLLGAIQFLIAGLISPLVGLAQDPTTGMAVVMLACLAVVLGAALPLARAGSDGTPAAASRLGR